MRKNSFFIGSLLISLFIVSCQKKEQSNLYFELKDINELTLSEVRIEKTFIIDDPDIRFKEIGSREGLFPDAVDWIKRKTAVGKRIGIYSFGTYYSAYIDLNDLQEKDIVFDSKSKKYTVWLPPIQIRESGRDFEIKTEHERVAFSRTPLTSHERSRAKNEAGKLLRQEIEKNGEFKRKLIREAKEKGRDYFEILLFNWGYQSEIKFKDE